MSKYEDLLNLTKVKELRKNTRQCIGHPNPTYHKLTKAIYSTLGH